MLRTGASLTWFSNFPYAIRWRCSHMIMIAVFLDAVVCPNLYAELAFYHRVAHWYILDWIVPHCL